MLEKSHSIIVFFHRFPTTSPPISLPGWFYWAKWVARRSIWWPKPSAMTVWPSPWWPGAAAPPPKPSTTRSSSATPAPARGARKRRRGPRTGPWPKQVGKKNVKNMGAGQSPSMFWKVGLASELNGLFWWRSDLFFAKQMTSVLWNAQNSTCRSFLVRCSASALGHQEISTEICRLKSDSLPEAQNCDYFDGTMI